MKGILEDFASLGSLIFIGDVGLFWDSPILGLFPLDGDVELEAPLDFTWISGLVDLDTPGGLLGFPIKRLDRLGGWGAVGLVGLNGLGGSSAPLHGLLLPLVDLAVSSFG